MRHSRKRGEYADSAVIVYKATVSLTLLQVSLTVVYSLTLHVCRTLLFTLADLLLIFITMLVRTASRFLLKSSVSKRVRHSDSIQIMHDFQMCVPKSRY